MGASECGLFALAFATDLCYGLDPANQHYDQDAMRQHYVSCLESKANGPFPKDNKDSATPQDLHEHTSGYFL